MSVETTPLDIVRDARSRKLVSADGESVDFVLSPGLSAFEIAKLEAELPCTIPPSIRELLEFCRGFSGPVELVDFTGASFDVELSDMFPHGLPIAADGFGNFWVADLAPDSRDVAPIYFHCHDAPVLLYQSASLSDFLAELFKLAEPPFASLVDDVHEDRLFQVWRDNPGVATFEECVASSDDVLKAFAERLDETYLVIDMRESEIGFGFSWGRYGPQTVVRRHGTEPVFAYQIKRGWVSRLLGRD